VSAVPTVFQAAALARARVRAVPVRLILTAIVLVSTGAETLLARLRLTPSAFPDEYVYSQLARSLASGGRLRVRGVSAHFPALLEPLLTAPVWLVHDVGTAYRLVQLENAFVMSLAAIPAYLIARRLGVAAGMSLAVAAVAVAGPQLLFVAMLESEPFAYPLALGAVAASIAVIERPTLRGQVLLLALSALATLARLQLAVLPLCVAVAVVVAGLRAKRVRDALREQRFLLAVIGAGAVAGVAVAFVHGFGYYHLTPTVSSPGRALQMAGVDVYVVLLGAGAALVPSALVGIWLALARPRSRGELAFGAVTVMIAAALVLQCVLWGDTQLVQERYLGYLFPLVALGFALRASRRPRRWVAELGVAAALAGVAALVPLSGYAIDASHSEAPVLYAFDELQAVTLHSSSGAAAVFALGATALAAIGVACTGGRRSFVPVGLALATSVALLAGAAAWAAKTNAIARAIYLPSDAAWVDHATGGKATLVATVGASRDVALATLFWNPSLTHVVLMPTAASPDKLAEPRVRVDPRGRLSVAGRPLTGALLVDAMYTTFALRHAHSIAHFATETLWRSRGQAELGALVVGRIPSGSLASAGRIQVWGRTPRLAGWIELHVGAPAALPRATVRLVAADGTRRAVSVTAGGTRLVRLRACGRGPWTATFAAKDMAYVAGAPVTATMSVPRYTPALGVCG
jgi:hypothetical protein